MSLEQAKRWMANEDLQKFIRQAQVDMWVGSKNGASDQDLNWTLFDFLNLLDNQLRPRRMVQGPDGKWQENILPKSLS